MSACCDLDAWAAIEAAAHIRANADHNEHVECRDRFHLDVTVRLALRFSEIARRQCEEAEANLMHSRERAARALSYMRRTTETLEQAVRLKAMGR